MSKSIFPVDQVSIHGAREHNLKELSLQFPRQKLVVITGLSGSGKSSLAFDTLYAEGQYRYMQTFSSYARSFAGELKRPAVDKIEGLGPVIAIEQKSTNRNPRSTLGTSTEIYDFLRVLYARIGRAYSQKTGQAFEKASESDIIDRIFGRYKGEKISILAPLIRSRKGHYRELFDQLYKQGYAMALVDGEMRSLQKNMKLDRFQNHDIAVVVDYFSLKEGTRLEQALRQSLRQGKNSCLVIGEDDQPMYFSTQLFDANTGLSLDVPAPNTFSFNTPQGACPECRGLGFQRRLDSEQLMPDRGLSLAQGGIKMLGPVKESATFRAINYMLSEEGYSLQTPLESLPEAILHRLLYGNASSTTFDVKGSETISELIKVHGVMGLLFRSDRVSKSARSYLRSFTCEACHGTRLRPEALQFKIDGQHISAISSLSLSDLHKWITTLSHGLSSREQQIAVELIREISTRTSLLLDLGLGYLCLDRPIASLSGGEAQRTRLATQIGNELVDVMYILDEPSIGLHARDNHRLINSLKKLRDMCNSVIVVEHDKDMMLASDYLIDMGPGAGKQGGYVVAAGPPAQFLRSDTLTSRYLKGEHRLPTSPRLRSPQGWFRLFGASGHNLKGLDFHLPLGCIVCLSGVSGSGKSTLIHHTLVPILKQHFYGSSLSPLPYTSVEGLDLVNKVIEVDQQPIGRTPRSNPATYTGIFTDIRALYAQLSESRLRGYTLGRFSFNVKGGRCEACQGGGMRVIEMDFLPDMYTPCEQCLSSRYNEETLEVRYRGFSIADVLDASIDKALDIFESQPGIRHKISTLQEVGLGYLTLGQHATTLSGGEAQRIKLSTELLRRDTGRTLYILDEPTTGLHFEDIKNLFKVLHKLVDKGNSVLVIEHNLEVLAAADYLIDIGPDSGDQGGRLVDQGTPAEVATRAQGPTGHHLSVDTMSQLPSHISSTP